MMTSQTQLMMIMRKWKIETETSHTHNLQNTPYFNMEALKDNTAKTILDEASHSFPILGEPELINGKTYIVNKKAVVGRTYCIVCPVCGNHVITTPDKKGIVIEKCRQCNANFGYKAKQGIEELATDREKESQAPLPTERHILSQGKGVLNFKGKLAWGFRGIHSAPLKAGQNIVGRKDVALPSDISFSDAYMSRQSIVIDVEKSPNLSGYTFRLTVKRASNPIMVNSNELLVGNSIYLNYGDTIRIGHTTLTFKAYKKQ